MKTSRKLAEGGRPSTGTMERQWEFMKAHFVNNVDDELGEDLLILI